MDNRPLDMAIVGGGLAGGLIALAVQRARPGMRIALLEAGASIGGNHRWSWFASDLDAAGTALMACFPAAHWNDGYEVRFPGYGRRLGTPYRSLSSSGFAAALAEALPGGTIRTGASATDLTPRAVTLANGETLGAERVLDCRSFAPSPHLRGGWQVFAGRHLRTPRSHGVERPILMDATVEQNGAYRFVYVLPLGPDELFVEDTYYADSPVLDRELLDERIAEYCAARGWTGETVGSEAGVLPVITGGDFAAYRASLGPAGVARAGARGGFAHPLTSYTLPLAVANALAIAGQAHLSGAQLAAMVEERARAHWRGSGFHRALGRMLFAAEPSRRHRIFARFYRLPQPLIERFYAGKSHAFDMVRILAGKPPMPVLSATGALLGKGAPLVHEDRR